MVDVISRDLSRNMSPNIILKLPEKAPPLNGSNSTVSGLWGDNSLGFAKTPIPISGPSPLEVYYGKINPDNIFINKGKDMNKQSLQGSGYINDSLYTMVNGESLMSVSKPGFGGKTIDIGGVVPVDVENIPKNLREGTENIYNERVAIENDPILKYSSNFAVNLANLGIIHKVFIKEHHEEIISELAKEFKQPKEKFNNLGKKSFSSFEHNNNLKNVVEDVLKEMPGMGGQGVPGVQDQGDGTLVTGGDQGNGLFPGKFPEEKHAYSTIKNGWYQYLGPRTRYKTRSARGDPGINRIDDSAKLHDSQYQKFSDMLDAGGDVTQEMVRKSDKQLLDNFELYKFDDVVVSRVASLVIQNKIRLEDLGLLDHLKFIRDGVL